MRKICKINKCFKIAHSDGYCNTHHKRIRRIGSPYDKDLKRGLYGKGTITPLGYRVIGIKGSYVLEHRLIMEKHLGRKLFKDETIHHKDRNKLNNDLDNLEILSWREHGSKHLRERCLMHIKTFSNGEGI